MSHPGFCTPKCQSGGHCTAANACDCAGTNFTGPTCSDPIGERVSGFCKLRCQTSETKLPTSSRTLLEPWQRLPCVGPSELITHSLHVCHALPHPGGVCTPQCQSGGTAPQHMPAIALAPTSLDQHALTLSVRGHVLGFSELCSFASHQLSPGACWPNQNTTTSIRVLHFYASTTLKV